MTHVDAIDLTDERAVREAWAVGARAHSADRPHAVLRSADALVASVAGERHWWHLLRAIEDRHLVGVATMWGGLSDNRHLVDLDIGVLPEARGRGVGRALVRAAEAQARAAGRSVVIGEAFSNADLAGATGSVGFAVAVGYRQVHAEYRLRLALPPTEAIAADLGAALSGRGALAASEEIVTWVDACPEAHLAAYARMRSQMNLDVPMGDLAVDPVGIDPAAVRDEERRHAGIYRMAVAASRDRRTGDFTGYTLVFLSLAEEARAAGVVQQDDTFVMPAHRGRGLGLRLKAAMIELLARDFPERRVIYTETAMDNHAMLRTNRALGFEVVETLHEMQRELSS